MLHLDETAARYATYVDLADLIRVHAVSVSRPLGERRAGAIDRRPSDVEGDRAESVRTVFSIDPGAEPNLK